MNFFLPRSTPIRNESGVVIMLLAILLVVIFAIVAMVVDGSRQSLVVEYVQNAADAASLGAVKQLNGKPSGMRLAKRAAVAVLKQTSVHGATVPIDATFQLNEPQAAPADIYEVNDPQNKYLKTEGTAGNVHVKIERGFYRDLGGPNGEVNFQFETLEGVPTLFGLDAHVLANAIRTTIEISNVPTSFGRVLGATDLGTIIRSSVSVFDSELEPCVAPFAIPACVAMLNTGTGSNFMTENFNPAMQCERELVAVEAIPEVAHRLEGMTRAKLYPLQPYIYFDGTPNYCMNNQGGYPPGWYGNCKAIQANLTLGVPSSDPGLEDDPASPIEVANVLKGNGGCIRARVGMRFRAMLNAVDITGDPIDNPNGVLQTSPGSPLETKLIQLINTSPDRIPFNQAFMNNGVPKPNYPHLRRLNQQGQGDGLSELRFQWPTSGSQGYGEMYMVPKGIVPGDENQWINPAAHTPGTGTNVKPINIMVVANANTAEPYCDYTALFGGTAPSAFPVSPSSEPTVVGIVPGFFFDFHIQKHAPNELIPGDDNPWSIQDLDVKVCAQQVVEYHGHHHDWAEIESCVECQQYPCDMDPGTPEPQCQPGPWCEQPGTCQNPGPPPPPPPPCPPPPPYVTQCFQPLPDLPDFSGFNMEDPSQYSLYEAAHQTSLAEWQEFLDGILDSLAGKECLPYKIDNCYPGTAASCWDVKDQKPQYLLGGFRVRLECESDQVLTGVNSTSEAKPLLVQ